jgi:hypothetical protein
VCFLVFCLLRAMIIVLVRLEMMLVRVMSLKAFTIGQLDLYCNNVIEIRWI